MRICSVDGCSIRHYTHGMCRVHARRMKTYGSTELPVNDPTCEVEGCARQKAYLGICQMHHKRLERFGSYELPVTTETERFWSKVQKTDTCWLWMGARTKGHGSFRDTAGEHVYAHRYSYEHLVGPIPDGLAVDHLCRVRCCVNPSHLEPVTFGENTRRGVRIGHDHPNAPRTCKRGHDWAVTPPLLAHRSNGKVSRRCRVCANELGRKRRCAA